MPLVPTAPDAGWIRAAAAGTNRPAMLPGSLACLSRVAAFAPLLALLALSPGCLHNTVGGPPARLSLPVSATASLPPMPSAGCRPDAPRGSAGSRTLTSGGRTRRFHLRLPEGAPRSTPAPLVLNLHGLYQAPALQELLSDLTAKAAARGSIVAYPAGLGRSWNAGSCCGRAHAEDLDDVRFLRDLVRQLGREQCIDRRRVYATGMSNGGLMSYRLACEASDVFAAVAPVAAVEAIPACTPTRPVAILAFNGDSDFIVRYGGGFPSSLSGLPSAPETADRWDRRNACAPGPRAVVWSSKEVRCEAAAGCRADRVLCTVAGGGHTWPGGMSVPYLGHTTADVDASETILDFFAGHALGPR